MSVYGDRKWIPTSGSKLTFDPATGFAINPDGKSAISFVVDFRNQVIGATGTGVVTVYGSMQKEPPDFTQPSTIDNQYAVIVLADYSLATSQYVTSLVVSSATKIAELNTNLLSWIAIHRSVDTVDVKLLEGDNQ